MSAAPNVVPFVRPDARPERENRARTQRVAMVVHDFRQPLNAIGLSVSSLKRARAAADDDVAADLERIQRAVRTLTRMTADLLHASALDARRPTLARIPVRVAGLVDEAVRSVPELDQRCEVIVDRDADVEVLADPGRIVQVLANLLANAVKHGECGGPIQVRVRRAPRAVGVVVSNRGAGIAPAELPHVFDPFYRAGRASTAPTGLGLGLTIAKALVDAHGGRIWAESVQNVATRFGFALPLGGAR